VPRQKTPESDRQVYVLRLYVTGATAASARAIANLKALCEQRLQGRFQLEVIDILQKPGLAAEEHIIAAPTLVRVLPAPLRRFIGDLSDLDGKLFGLDAHPR
jgi:circadian clock protein KaiB